MQRGKNKIIKLTAMALVALFTTTSLSTFTVKGVDQEKAFAKGNPEATTDILLNYSSQEEFLSTMDMVENNDKFELYFDKNSLSICVKNKSSQELWFSNAYNTSTDKYYAGDNKKRLNSQFQVTYADSQGALKTLYSADDCVAYGQWEAVKIQDGFALNMKIGQEKSKQLVPEKISEERFTKKILEPLANNQKALKKIKAYYKLENGFYEVRKLNNKESQEVEDYLKEAGYTYDDLIQDHQANGVTSAAQVFPCFSIRVEYRLTENGMELTIPADKISFDRKNFQLVNITALEYFGAVSSAEKNDGYIFIPDGCGAIIDYNDQTPQRQSIISAEVYGFDTSMTYPDDPRQGRNFSLPVFGVKKGSNGMLAIIKDGDALSKISAYAGNHFGQYYTAFPTFQYTAREVQSLDQKVTSHGSSTQVYLYDNNYYKGNYVVEYMALEGENQSNYVGMANRYRDYLIEQGFGKNKNVSNSILSLETLGTINYTERFLGVPYNAASKLTTFEQNLQLIQTLKEKGVENLNLTMEAWRKDGLTSSVANRFDPSPALGGKNDFKDLINWCNDNNVPVYPNIDMVFVSYDRWFDGFSSNKHSIRKLDDKLGGLLKIRPDTGQYDKSTFKFGLSPSLYQNTINKFIKSYKKSDANSLGLGSMGSYLNSNFSEKNSVNRQQALEYSKKTAQIAGENYNLSFQGANAYILPYASQINNVPMTSSGYRGTKSVGFIQMVLRGYTNYSSEPINYEPDETIALLRCIETGTAPHFILAADQTIKIKKTKYTQYYSIDQRHWVDTAANAYKTFDKIISQVDGSEIVSHEYLAESVVRVSYKNNCSIIINYTSDPFEYQGNTIAATSAQLFKGGDIS